MPATKAGRMRDQRSVSTAGSGVQLTAIGQSCAATTRSGWHFVAGCDAEDTWVGSRPPGTLLDACVSPWRFWLDSILNCPALVLEGRVIVTAIAIVGGTTRYTHTDEVACRQQHFLRARGVARPSVRYPGHPSAAMCWPVLCPGGLQSGDGSTWAGMGELC